MRVAFVSRRYFPAISGMSVYALNLLRELVAGGHDVVMVSQYRGDAAGSAVYGGGPPPDVPGVKVVGLESLGEQRVNAGEPADFEADLQAMIDSVLVEHESKPFDIVHAQYGYPNGLAALECGRRLGLPVVVSIQGGDGHWVGTCCDTHRRAMRAVLFSADALLIGSRSFAEEVRGHHGVPVERFTIVPGATDTARFSPRADRPAAALGMPPTLLFHGRVDFRKGVGELIAAFDTLTKTRDLRLTVSGIGPDVEAARQQVRERDLCSRVRFTGYTGYFEAADVYRAGDVFVSPTYSEGFSNTILEAMACGVPVVSTNAVGVVDCITHESNGLLVEPRDADGLAEALARILDDHALRARVTAQALADVRRLYSWDAVGRQIQDVYAHWKGRGPAPDGWLQAYDPRRETRETADLSCRFRPAPHLL